MKTGIKVSDAMSTKPITVDPEETVKNCARLMVKRKVGSVIAKEGQKMVGILTEKDIVRLVAKDNDLNNIKVKQVMTKRVKTIEPEDDLYDAMMRMKRKKVRRLPVVVGKELVGMLTMNDVLKIQPFLYDFIKEKYQVLMLKKPRQEYIEGRCEICDNYAQLYRVQGKLACEECKDQLA